MAARSADVVTRIAGELGIGWSGTDWRRALEELAPDIVAVGTPGGAHLEPILAAIEAGCHVYCDKPLAVDAPSARRISDAALAKSVKTAFAASFCYEPAVAHAERLIADGAIGELCEVECLSAYALNPLIPFGWSHRVSEGGGRLNNNFTHKLAIVLRATGGRLTKVTGEVRNDMLRAPLGEHQHDFRYREKGAPTARDAERGEWREVDSDWSYTVLGRLAPGFGGEASLLFKHAGLQPRRHEDCVRLLGTTAAIHIDGAYATGALSIQEQGGAWRELETPEDITASLPAIGDATQRNWTVLAGAFLDDLAGRPHLPYLSFREGWLFQEVIDLVRAGASWTELPGPAWPRSS